MDTYQFSAKLEPFLLVAKGLKGAAAAKMIRDATSAPGVYVFGELLEVDGIKELKSNAEYSQFYELLRVFAYKTYEDYRQTPGLPPLTPVQETKLKQLSIVSLAGRGRLIPYSLLLTSLNVPTVRELEDLVIEAIYGGILQGKLDQQSASLEIEYTMGRDVDIESGGLEEILAGLRGWADQTAQVLHTLDNKLAEIAATAAARRQAKEEDDRIVQARLKEVTASSERERQNTGPGPARARTRGDSYDDDYSGWVGNSGRVLGERPNANANSGGGGGGGGMSRMRRMLGGGKDERDASDPRDRENTTRDLRGDGMDVDEPAVGRGKNRKASLESVGSQQGGAAGGSGSGRGPVRKRNKF